MHTQTNQVLATLLCLQDKCFSLFLAEKALGRAKGQVATAGKKMHSRVLLACCFHILPLIPRDVVVTPAECTVGHHSFLAPDLASRSGLG